MREGDFGYDQALTKAFVFTEPSFENAALFGALAIEASMAGNMFITMNHLAIFRITIEDLSHQPWLEKIGDQLMRLSVTRVTEAIRRKPQVMESYSDMMMNVPSANQGSAAAAFLKRHDRLLWEG
jgi:hypothetical protein